MMTNAPIYDTPKCDTLGAALELHFKGYQLATAEILYYMPDHPSLLQSFIWQQIDLVPGYPALTRFMDFWRENIEARLHSIKVASTKILEASTYQTMQAPFRLH